MFRRVVRDRLLLIVGKPYVTEARDEAVMPACRILHYATLMRDE
jgi:hypothetical protein